MTYLPTTDLPTSIGLRHKYLKVFRCHIGGLGHRHVCKCVHTKDACNSKSVNVYNITEFRLTNIATTFRVLLSTNGKVNAYLPMRQRHVFILNSI